MFSYVATLTFTAIDYYGEDRTETEYKPIVFSDESLWIARNKMLLYLANQEWTTEFLYYYDVIVKLQLPDNQEPIYLGTWCLRFVGREKWRLDWEKEKQIFRDWGYLTPENEPFYQLTQELYAPPPDEKSYLDLVEKFLEFGKQMPDFQRLCAMHIGLIYLRIRKSEIAFKYFSQGNESEIKSLFYRAAFAIKFIKTNSLETFNKTYPEEQ